MTKENIVATGLEQQQIEILKEMGNSLLCK